VQKNLGISKGKKCRREKDLQGEKLEGNRKQKYLANTMRGTVGGKKHVKIDVRSLDCLLLFDGEASRSERRRGGHSEGNCEKSTGFGREGCPSRSGINGVKEAV